MTKNFKFSIAVLLALCLLTGAFLVSCQGDMFGEDSETDAETLTDGNETESELEVNGETETETEAVTEEQTIGHSEELGDDGFIKVEWGKTTN